MTRSKNAEEVKQNSANAAGEERRVAPAASRNCAPIIEVLREKLPNHGRVLEVASGTGQHIAAFAKAFPTLEWQPSDIAPEQLKSITAWRKESGLQNLVEPLIIDISSPWPMAHKSAEVVLTINLLHLIPETYVASFFHEAGKVLAGAGRLIIYGPFMRGTSYASEGDRAFDTSLRAQDPLIGYKSIESIIKIAEQSRFKLAAIDEMPANNLVVTFEAQP